MRQELHLLCPTAADTQRLGRLLGATARAGDVVVLSGGLGAGKTTFTQGFADGLQVRGPITSPTFVIARVHPSLVQGPALVHVDAYRLADGAELDDLDLDATVAASVTVIEWGTGLAEVLAHVRLEVALWCPDATDDRRAEALDDLWDEPRRIHLHSVGQRWDEPLQQVVQAGFSVEP